MAPLYLAYFNVKPACPLRPSLLRAAECPVTINPMRVIASWEKCAVFSLLMAYIWREMDETIKLETSWTILKCNDILQTKMFRYISFWEMKLKGILRFALH